MNKLSNITARSSGTKKAVIFARVGNTEPLSDAERAAQLAVQQDYCRGVASALAAEVVGEYVARGGTAEPAVRQVVEQLLALVDAGGTDYVIVSSLDRVTRQPRELVPILNRLSSNGVQLVTTADAAAQFQQAISLYLMVKTTESWRLP